MRHEPSEPSDRGKSAPAASAALLDAREDAARFDRHGGVDRIDGANPVEARQRKHDSAIRDTAADETRVPALRDNRDTRPGADPDDLRDLFGRARPGHRDGLPSVKAPLLDEVGGYIGLGAQNVLLADCRSEVR